MTWCFFNVPVQELQTSRVATPQKELIYTLIHGRDPIPCRTTYIEYKSQGEDSLFFKIGTPPNSIGFHCKVGFFVLFHCSTAPVVGVTLGELEKIIFFNKTKRNLSFGWPGVFLMFQFRNFRHPRSLLPKGNWSIPLIIHGRDPIPCRTTYIEYKSQGEDSPFVYRNTTQFHWFSLQSSFFHCSTAPVVGVTLGELEKLFFFTQNKQKFIISGDLVFFFHVPVQELQTSRFLLPKRKLIYTLIHGRDSIPCRTTYIECTS